MRLSIVRVVVVVFCISCGALPVLADWDTSPGTNAVFASRSGVTIPNCRSGDATLVSAVLKEGSAKSVLTVEAMMLFEKQIPPVAGPARITARPAVNGVFMEPSAGVTYFPLSQQCPADITFCTITGIFWLDLDVAEAIHPGTFYGKPLTIKVSGCEVSGGGGAIAHITVKAQIIKK